MLRHFPIAGPNLRAAEDVVVPADQLLASTSEALLAMRSLDGVVEEQRLMVEQAERVAQHGDTAIAHAMELHRNLQGERNVWVLNSLGRRLDALSDRVDPVAEMSGVSLVDSARHLLGSDEPRSYLLLLGNPAEARELGGFAGGPPSCESMTDRFH